MPCLLQKVFLGSAFTSVEEFWTSWTHLRNWGNHFQVQRWNQSLPSGNLLHSYGKWPFIVSWSFPFNMVIFNRYFKLPEVNSSNKKWQLQFLPHMKTPRCQGAVDHAEGNQLLRRLWLRLFCLHSWLGLGHKEQQKSHAFPHSGQQYTNVVCICLHHIHIYDHII